MGLEAEILLFIQDHVRNGVLDPIMKAASFLGDRGLLWILLGLLLLAVPKTRRAGFNLIVCLALATAVSNLGLKNLFARVRPYEAIEGLSILVKPESSWSFPSGHACASFASATAIFLSLRGKSAWLYLPASLIAVSRVYVGVHYPTDILAGALVGAGLSYLACKLLDRYVFNNQAGRGGYGPSG